MGFASFISWLFRGKTRKLLLFLFIVFLPSLLLLTNDSKTYPITRVMQKVAANYVVHMAKPHIEKCPYPLKQSKPISPLAPMNQRFLNADPPLTKKQINELLELGCGLEEYETETGNRSWQENGIIYLPKGDGHRKIADVYNADYVPFIPYNHTLFFEGRNHSTVPTSERKIILSRMAGMDDINTPTPLSACPDFPCVVTTSWNKYLQRASGITLNAQLISGPPPIKRRANQILIFYIYEPLEPNWKSLTTIRNPKYNWKTAFNWTMSYHVDSDIYMPYGVVRPRPTPILKNYTAILAQKRKQAAWFVSHCPTFSKREEYVKELQRYLPVDIYGHCGPHKCSREKDIECFTRVSQTYKFYFSFENAICEDYTTEKFFKILKTDTVIVARGSSSYFKTVPDGIYINTADFESPKELAKHLQYLDRTDEEYIKILKKKDQFFASYQDYPHKVGKTVWVKYNWERIPMCEVCQRLWNIDKYENIYPDIGQWVDDKMCREPTDI